MTQALRLLAPSDVPFTSGRLYRVSAAAVGTIALGMAAIVIACIAFGSRDGALFGAQGIFPAVLLWWVVLWLGMFFLFYANDWRKVLGRGGWLALADSEGVYIKYRSYRNASWSQQDAQVVFVPYAVIATAHIDKRTWRTPASQTRRTQSERVTYVELELGDVDTSGFAKVLADERAGKPGRTARGTKLWRHFPVTIEPGNILRIEWRARPSASIFTEALAARGVTVRSQTRTLSDLSNVASDQQVRELARRGQVIDLVRVLRTHSDMTLTQAKTEAERLIAEASGKDG